MTEENASKRTSCWDHSLLLNTKWTRELPSIILLPKKGALLLWNLVADDASFASWCHCLIAEHYSKSFNMKACFLAVFGQLITTFVLANQNELLLLSHAHWPIIAFVYLFWRLIGSRPWRQIQNKCDSYEDQSDDLFTFLAVSLDLEKGGKFKIFRKEGQMSKTVCSQKV